MSVGLGIFLSALFLGFIFLFNKTKDRWNWKKIILIWPLSIALIIGIVGGAGLYISANYDRWIKFFIKPETYNTYLDISLNGSESDVIFIKGNEGYTKKISVDKKDILYRFNESGRSMNIRIKDNKVWHVYCYSTEYSRCPLLNQVGINDSGDFVTQSLGEPSQIFASDDNTRRIWIYEKWNIHLVLEKAHVLGLGIFEPALGVPQFNDDKLLVDERKGNFPGTPVPLTSKVIPLEEKQAPKKRRIEVTEDGVPITPKKRRIFVTEDGTPITPPTLTQEK